MTGGPHLDDAAGDDLLHQDNRVRRAMRLLLDLVDETQETPSPILDALDVLLSREGVTVRDWLAHGANAWPHRCPQCDRMHRPGGR